MIATAAAKPAPASQAPPVPVPFAKPKPGSWLLDASHCERPVPLLIQPVFSEMFSKGFREGLEKYGALLETIEVAFVNGFIYTCARPLGAPPEPKGTPPKLVFKLLTRLHPGLRKRIATSEAMWAAKPWREETRLYVNEWMKAVEAHMEKLLRVPLKGLDDAALSRHAAECYEMVKGDTYVHHRMNCARVVPVGDFIAQASAWTGAPASEALNTLRGFSPDSRMGLPELEALAGRVRADAALARQLKEGSDAEALISGLEARRDAVGEAARAWIGVVGHQVTGFSPAYPTLRETPSTLLESLRGALNDAPARDTAEESARRALNVLRKRVPAARQREFDALLEEARHVYFIRDHSCLRGTAAFGILRLAALEAGRRLAAHGLIPEADSALDMTLADLQALLAGRPGPSLEELRKRLAWRRTATSEIAPDLLGPVPGEPPPADWLPAGAARLMRAVDVYVHGMFDEAKKKNEDRTLLRGLSASPGKRTGKARLVLAPGDFDKVQAGDVLVARITTPSYNVLLPLLSGIVTDRGGILSHPAIVSREFGIPGVVGARNATALIPDGAMVEIDGDAGTVRVLP